MAEGLNSDAATNSTAAAARSLRQFAMEAFRLLDDVTCQKKDN